MTPQMHEWSPQDFIAGELCLEFTNTVGDHRKTREINWLTDWNALLRWAVAASALQASEAEALRKIGRRDRATVGRCLQELLDLRDVLYRVLAALAARREPAPADFKRLEVSVFAALSAAKLTPRNEAYAWAVSQTDASMMTPLARIALSALRLLQSDDLSRLRECQRCSWLFLDRSKNRGRRWCRADACGNRARVARHYRTRGL
jgi:predicted RNA-binding Zn ribbon-like protein